jgi:hypothetical protein
MISNRLKVVLLSLAALCVYLFVSAPPPLADGATTGAKIPTRTLLEIANYENNVVRALYTKEIVGAGKKAGLKFDEHWMDSDMQAGPLPAQFLRETARSLEKSPVRLNLYLGSNLPINPANHFEGESLRRFLELRADRQPRYFRVADSGTYAYMAADVAISQPCVDCHNAHVDSPKQDWRLNDVMGATTWTYPEDTLGLDEAVQSLAALRLGFRDAYTKVLKKMASLKNPPHIGQRWPSEGYYLPSEQVFIAEIDKRISAHTLNELYTVSEKTTYTKSTEKK